MCENGKKLKEGDIIELGHYMETDNCKKTIPMEWIVLGAHKNRALLLSRYAIALKQYDEELKETNWRQSSVRDWLSDDFKNGTFDDSEWPLVAKNNFMVDIGREREQQPRIFLLNADEVSFYLRNDEDRKCLFADLTDTGNVQYKPCCWWTRSRGQNGKYAAIIKKNGEIIANGMKVTSQIGVRPALWLKADEYLEAKEMTEKIQEEYDLDKIEAVVDGVMEKIQVNKESKNSKRIRKEENKYSN